MLNNKIQVMVNGAQGKMGRLACEALQNDDRFHLVAAMGRYDHLAEQLEKQTIDVVLDLTRADCIWANCQQYLKYPLRFVIGASGLEATQIAEIASRCNHQKQGGAIIPNFSIGAILNIHFAKLAAKWFDGVDIIEMHHAQKMDSPSATAIYTAHEILHSKTHWPNMSVTPQAGRETFIKQTIPIHSVRMPGLLANQQILFGQQGETITLSHQIIDRQAYMPGILLSCEKIMQHDEFVMGLEHWILSQG